MVLVYYLEDEAVQFVHKVEYTVRQLLPAEMDSAKRHQMDLIRLCYLFDRRWQEVHLRRQ